MWKAVSIGSILSRQKYPREHRYSKFFLSSLKKPFSSQDSFTILKESPQPGVLLQHWMPSDNVKRQHFPQSPGVKMDFLVWGFEDKSPLTISRTSIIHSEEGTLTWTTFGRSVPMACYWGVEGIATRQNKILLVAESLYWSLWPGQDATHKETKNPKKTQIKKKPQKTPTLEEVKIIL